MLNEKEGQVTPNEIAEQPSFIIVYLYTAAQIKTVTDTATRWRRQIAVETRDPIEHPIQHAARSGRTQVADDLIEVLSLD